MLIDGIIGPLLELLGVIEIDETGEWKRVHKEYQKKERPERPSLFERIKAWFNKLWLRINEERKKPDDLLAHQWKNDEKVKAFNNPRSKVKAQEHLRKITKMEGKLLAGNEQYRLWVGDHFPYDDEIEEGVVYVIRGQGDPVAPNSRYLSGIRQDAYYVWDKTNERFEEIGTNVDMDSLTGEIDIRRKKADLTAELKGLQKANDELKDSVKGLRKSLKELSDTNRKTNEMVKNYWDSSFNGLVVYDPNKCAYLRPNSYEDEWYIEGETDRNKHSGYIPPFY